MRDYAHAEAFCLMHYKCKKCGLLEPIWNSRDGVAPFTMSCGSCSGESVHDMNAHPMIISVDLPETATRVFVNCTKEDAADFANRWYESLKTEPKFQVLIRQHGRKTLTSERAKSMYGKGKHPFPLFRRQYLLRKVKNEQKAKKFH